MDSLQPGDRLRLHGGYDPQPAWLGSSESLEGTVVQFITGQNKAPAAVVRMDLPVSAEGVTGEILVLELRYVGAAWGPTETVHIELCDFMPEPKAWAERRQGKWVESNATYDRLPA